MRRALILGLALTACSPASPEPQNEPQTTPTAQTASVATATATASATTTVTSPSATSSSTSSAASVATDSASVSVAVDGSGSATSSSNARPDGLVITDLKMGQGRAAKSGDKLFVHYVGRLRDGTVFDDSHPRGDPFQFELGGNMVIKGWDQGLVGMRAGGRRRIEIPPALGYGGRGVPPKIPPNATLFFEVELVRIQ